MSLSTPLENNLSNQCKPHYQGFDISILIELEPNSNPN